MGILDNIVGSLLGGSNNQPQGGNQTMGGAGIAGVLSSLLAGGQSGGMGGAGAGSAGGGLGGLGGTMGAGGIGGLVSQFEQAGLGNVVQSWIGNGANSPISPQQLQNVFGDKIPGMAQQGGRDPGDFRSPLRPHLPGGGARATPNGQVQGDGSVDV